MSRSTRGFERRPFDSLSFSSVCQQGSRKQRGLGLRRSDKQQATNHGRVLEEIDELRDEGACASDLPKGVPQERCGNQENQQCHGCQSRIDAEGQTKACDYFKASSAQHEKMRQAGGCTMLDEFVCSKSLADRKSTRLNSSHLVISYAVFCLKKKNNTTGDGVLAAAVDRACGKRVTAARAMCYGAHSIRPLTAT